MKLVWLDPAPGQAPCTTADLAAVGALHERLPLDPQAYQPPLDHLKAERGYVEQDIIELSPTTPNLEALCAKFIDEHLHTDDEVRYVLEGEGIFDLRSASDQWMRVTVVAGDLLVVPANLHHRFMLTERKQIRCVRLFKDSSGWVPHYRAPSSPAPSYRAPATAS
jgi:1,2-dihydroxy-3-keto-5-methylthiopentene dioxygenase